MQSKDYPKLLWHMNIVYLSCTIIQKSLPKNSWKSIFSSELSPFQFVKENSRGSLNRFPASGWWWFNLFQTNKTEKRKNNNNKVNNWSVYIGKERRKLSYGALFFPRQLQLRFRQKVGKFLFFSGSGGLCLCQFKVSWSVILWRKSFSQPGGRWCLKKSPWNSTLGTTSSIRELSHSYRFQFAWEAAEAARLRGCSKLLDLIVYVRI